MRKLTGTSALAIMLFFGVMQGRADTCNGFASNLVSNCSFETGSLSSWTGTATTASPNYAGVDSGDPFTTAPTPYAGTYEAYLGQVGSTIALTQTLATTAGANYLIEFALLNDTSPAFPYSNSFSLVFGGTSLFSESAVTAGGYTLYSYTGVAASNATALSFVSRNDDGYFELDSVSVSAAATPEPSSWMLLASGMLGVAGMARRRLLTPR